MGKRDAADRAIRIVIRAGRSLFGRSRGFNYLRLQTTSIIGVLSGIASAIRRLFNKTTCIIDERQRVDDAIVENVVATGAIITVAIVEDLADEAVVCVIVGLGRRNEIAGTVSDFRAEYISVLVRSVERASSYVNSVTIVRASLAACWTV